MADKTERSDGMLVSDEVKTGYVRGIAGMSDFRVKEVKYVEVDGQAVFEGCILLGPVEQMETLRRQVEENGGVDLLNEVEPFGLTVLDRHLWPQGVMNYRIDDALPNQERVHAAMKHWTDNTQIQFRKRTDETDFVTFRPGGGCAANVGRIGGEQSVVLGPGCSVGNTIHEIGHALGFWHEQGRSDRDQFIDVHFENILDNREHNFDQHITDGIDRGAYDYGSIMHYGTHFFSRNGEPTISTPNGEEIGQREGLSEGDISAIHLAYAREIQKRS